ncbi:MAG TPA: hypothetical protein VNN77_03740 [candidate division Zixibacteria bacterium]|nr:hypothetical protein [candidate division Zixibacteria bacterium]
MEFSTGELELLDAAGYSRRGTKNLMPDAYDFSQRLRVIGDFLDRRRAGDFRISWTAAGAEITYATPAGARLKETFQSDTLYDLWIHMYLRRRRRPG